MTPYVELQVTSNFSFLRGASHPQELVTRAAKLGHAAAAIADRNTLAGAVRTHAAAKKAGIKALIGVRLELNDDFALLCFPTDRPAYGRLCQLLTLGKRRAAKGECHLDRADAIDHGEGQIVVVIPPADNDDLYDPSFAFFLEQIGNAFADRAYLAASFLYRGDDIRRIAHLDALARRYGVPLVATNDAHYHDPARRPLHDVVTCIREHCTLDEAGFRLQPNAERHLKSGDDMARLFAAWPDALARTVEIADRIHFSLDELAYEYPVEPVPEGRTPQAELVRLTWIGADRRYPQGVPEKIRATIEKELALIEQLNYAPYFLTVYDIVKYAREQDPPILCQGRGSSANSVVCFCLTITSVDPVKQDLLFERFVSAARNEPPDIDVDFEHERREEVIQYIYKKYGRDRAGLAATVISYRPRSAIREVGKVLGLSDDVTGALAKNTWGWSDAEEFLPDQIRQLGLDPDDRTLMLAIAMARDLMGFPRHLSQHVGGFVITKGPLCEMVPIENAAMEDRTVVEWDKDDLDELHMLKIDVLALGMLTCIRKALDLLRRHYFKDYELATIPPDDPVVYDMLCRADSVGVFQVESRAQMSMLPRLKPRTMYDLVIEVAIVRPGPIQGDMVHPYLRRRNGQETVNYPKPELKEVLHKTLGVPLFQEQAMRIAIVAAGFTPDEADQLRRAMATFRKMGTIQNFRIKMVEGMVERGYQRDFAERCFNQIQGFGEYGFPESHAASFALLVYVSAWLKCHHPEVFACAILNSQPMGFYAPAQLVRDAQQHGVEVLPVDVNRSTWDNALEPGQDGRMALRLGFRQARGLREGDVGKLVAARGNAYTDPLALWKKSGLKPAILERIARADAFASMGLSRREALWSVKGLGEAPLPMFEAADENEIANEPQVSLPAMPLGEQVVEDYATLRLSLKAHPLQLLRPRLDEARVTANAALDGVAAGDFVTVAGLVIIRQRPGTAKGVIFMTLEDDGGICNIIVWPHVLEKYRRIVVTGRMVKVVGQLQREGLVTHIVAHRLFDLSDYLDGLSQIDARFENALARADEVARPGRDHRSKNAGHVPALDVMYPSRDFH